MGFTPRPHQVVLNLERLNLRSVNLNLMGHVTWLAASLQARLWERLARLGRKSLLPPDGRFRQGMARIWTNKTTYISTTDPGLRGNDGNLKRAPEDAAGFLPAFSARVDFPLLAHSSPSADSAAVSLQSAYFAQGCEWLGRS